MRIFRYGGLGTIASEEDRVAKAAAEISTLSVRIAKETRDSERFMAKLHNRALVLGTLVTDVREVRAASAALSKFSITIVTIA